MKIQNILALGCGTMGSQPGFYYAMHGFNVTQFDISEEALAACKAYHRRYVEPFRAAFPSFTDEDIDAGLARISYSSDLEVAARDIDFVTESVPEVLEIKQQVYADLNRYCPAHTIFATNTSTMAPSAMVESTGRPERFLAVHYAVGMWDSPIAEVMKHPGTDDAVFQEVVEFVQSSKLVPIKIEIEQPGYIINSLLVPWLSAGLSLVVNGVSSHQDVDRTWMICAQGMRMGPIGVIDQVGFEVSCNIHRLKAAEEPDNPQYQKNIDYLEEYFLSKGHTGALSGQGFYSYPDPEYLEPGFLK
ncbi:MAG: 3-hydroxyacyl-CoA dehydrogenase [Haliea sp.]|nr:3-hydroxyacyl-CoA dehydrogenase [Haliea sp.]